MEITLGSTITKPVETQEQCTAYAAMAEAVNAHNAACAVGDTLWGIEDKADCYEVAEGGTVPEPEPAKHPAHHRGAAGSIGSRPSRCGCAER